MRVQRADLCLSKVLMKGVDDLAAKAGDVKIEAS